MEIIKAISATIGSSTNAESIVNLSLDLALISTNAQRGSVMLIDEKGLLSVKASKGIDTKIIPQIRLKLGERICGKVAKDRSSLLVTDIKTDERVSSAGNGTYKTGSFICCPIMNRGKVLGVINVSEKTDGTVFSEDELELIGILAGQTAVSLDFAYLSDHLRSRMLELDERNRVIAESDRMRRDFVALMSHEFRTPLNSIAGAAYYLKEKKAPKQEQKEFVSIISEETGKLINLLNGILDFSLLDKEGPVLKKKILNLGDILHDISNSIILKDSLAINGISLQISIAGQLPLIVGEKVRLIQAFTNLIEGCEIYTVPGDRIVMTAAPGESSVSVSLTIPGREVPEQELPFLFVSRSPWSELAEAKNRFMLYAAKKTFQQLGGTVSAHNTPQGISIQVLFTKDMAEYREARINELSDLFLSLITEVMNLNKCSLMLKDPSTDELSIRSAIGIDEDVIRDTRVRDRDKIAGKVVAESRPLLIENIETYPGFSRKSSSRYSTKSLICLPVIADNRTIGVLNLNNKADGSVFDREDLYLATALAERVSNTFDKIMAENPDDSEFQGIVKNIETLLYNEKRHTKKNGRLSSLTFTLMEHLHRPEEEIREALYASAFYDLGLTQIDENILMKSETLSPIEEKVIRTHPFPAAELMDRLERADSVKKAILHHHERFDGTGYPTGLKGKDIPFLSRVLGVVDAYSAMVSDRPYRKALVKEDAVSKIRSGAGTQFDPEIAEALVKIVSNDNKRSGSHAFSMS